MLNEHDLADYQQLPIQKLHDCKPKSYIKVGEHVLFFSHLDGMYSFCTTLANEVVHIAAWAEVIPLQKPD